MKPTQFKLADVPVALNVWQEVSIDKGKGHDILYRLFYSKTGRNDWNKVLLRVWK